MKDCAYIVAIALLLIPSTAFAHGDISVLYLTGSIIVVQSILAIYLLLSKRIVGHRVPFLGIYVASVASGWCWATGFPGPKWFYLELTAGPLFTCLCLIQLARGIRKT
jgi:hypothetical protein